MIWRTIQLGGFALVQGKAFVITKHFLFFQSQVGWLAFLWGESNLESNPKERRRSWSEHERTNCQITNTQNTQLHKITNTQIHKTHKIQKRGKEVRLSTREQNCQVTSSFSFNTNSNEIALHICENQANLKLKVEGFWSGWLRTRRRRWVGDKSDA